MRFLTIILLFLTTSYLWADDDKIIWQHQEYITKEIDGGYFTLTLTFDDKTGKFRNYVKGAGNFALCDFHFYGKGTKTSNPLYGHDDNEYFFSDLKNRYVNIKGRHVNFERRGNRYIYNGKRNWFFCQDFHNTKNPTKKNIPDQLRFYPKTD